MNFPFQHLIAPPEPRWRLNLRGRTEAIHSPEPVFNLQVGSVGSYDEMFAGTVRSVWTEVNVVEEALRHGRVLISGRGGGAKTVLLGRLAKRALKMGHIPAFLPLKAWTQAHTEEWRKSDSSIARMDFLFRSLLGLGIGTADFDSLQPNVPRVFFVDGLNEVDGRTAQELIFTLDGYASAAINTSVIVSDRLVRREFIRPEQWSLCLALPLSDAEIERQLSSFQARDRATVLSDDERELLSTPYFLDAYLRGGQLAETRAEEIRKWFETHAGLTDGDLGRASEAAYVVYGSASRTFDLRTFEAIAGSDTGRRLIESGALLADGYTAIFDHHLKHDFLASSFLAGREDLWNSKSFDHVTFSASSFDAIMMCVEQVDEGGADRFIRAVYDWNLYGVGYSLGESRKHNVSAEMRTVILAMFAEKKWDLVWPTRQRAEDTLRLLKEEDARMLLQTKSLEEVFEFVRMREPSLHAPWFLEWRELFTRPNSAVSDELINFLRYKDSVRGWTAANVLKRVRLSDAQQQMVRSFLESTDPVVRWRAAHVLGSLTSDLNAEALLGCLVDQDQKVRYGAVRSLLELASLATEGLRRDIFANLIHERERLVEFTPVREEIRRCVLIPGARDPSSWLQYCLKLMSAVQPVGVEAERDRWSRFAQQLINMFTATEKPSSCLT